MGWKQTFSHRQVPRIGQLCLHTEARGPGTMSRGTAWHSALRHEARAFSLTFTPAQVSAIMHEVVLPIIIKLPLQRNEQIATLQGC